MSTYNPVDPTTKAIKSYILEHPKYLTGSYQEIADKFEVSPESVRHVARKVRKELAGTSTEGTESIPEEFNVTEEVLIRKDNAAIKSLKKQLEQSVKAYGELSDMYDVALGLKTQELSYEVPKIEPNYSNKSEACAILQVSDGHFGKIINPSTVNGLNSYNESIARKRMDTLADNTIKLINKERSAVKIDNLLLILGGDYVNNSSLHEHEEMASHMSPIEEVMFSRELLSKYINTISQYGKFKKITISCVRGNHSRLTKKMSASIDFRMNYETIIYQILKSEFNDPMFVWDVPDSEISEVEVFGYMLRNIHGFQCRYGGGIGGLTIPLNKYIMRQDSIRKADHTFLHHFHNYSFPTVNSTLNGSICGIDPYAFSLGCSFQRPIQSFKLLDKEKGFTINAPVFCD